MTVTDTKLQNKYEDIQKTDALKKSVLAKKLENSVKGVRDHAQKIMLGEDGKVGESVIMTFFNALYGDIATAYKAYKEHRLKQELEQTEKNIQATKKNLETLKEFQEKTQRINDFTRLSIQKAALEQKLNDKTIDAGARVSAIESLKGVVEKIDKIADFYETTSDLMTKMVEKTEGDWLGDNAKLMKDLRIFSPEIKEKVLPGVSVDDIINNKLLVTDLVAKVSNSIIEADLVETLDGLKDAAQAALQTDDLK